MEEFWLFMDGDNESVHAFFANGTRAACEEIKEKYGIELQERGSKDDQVAAKGSIVLPLIGRVAYTLYTKKEYEEMVKARSPEPPVEEETLTPNEVEEVTKRLAEAIRKGWEKSSLEVEFIPFNPPMHSILIPNITRATKEDMWRLFEMGAIPKSRMLAYLGVKPLSEEEKAEIAKDKFANMCG